MRRLHAQVGEGDAGLRAGHVWGVMLRSLIDRQSVCGQSVQLSDQIRLAQWRCNPIRSWLVPWIQAGIFSANSSMVLAFSGGKTGGINFPIAFGHRSRGRLDLAALTNRP